VAGINSSFFLLSLNSQKKGNFYRSIASTGKYPIS